MVLPAKISGGSVMAVFLVFDTNLLNLYRSSLLMHKLLPDYQGNIMKRILKEK